MVDSAYSVTGTSWSQKTVNKSIVMEQSTAEGACIVYNIKQQANCPILSQKTVNSPRLKGHVLYTTSNINQTVPFLKFSQSGSAYAKHRHTTLNRLAVFRHWMTTWRLAVECPRMGFRWQWMFQPWEWSCLQSSYTRDDLQMVAKDRWSNRFLYEQMHIWTA